MVLSTEWSQVEVIDLVNDGSGLGKFWEFLFFIACAFVNSKVTYTSPKLNYPNLLLKI